MKRAFVASFIAIMLLAGCRQEDWRELAFEMPQGVSFATLQSALQALDRETPPEVRLEQGIVFVRFNSMHLSARNLTYVRDELLRNQAKEKAQ
jgi:hypothetical protein